MGVKYSAQESQELIQAMTNNLQVANEVTDRLSSGCDHLISSLDSGELTGAAYTAGKGLFTEIIIPSIKKLQAAIDDIQLELTSYKNADAQVSGYGDLDLDQLKELKKLREEQLAIVEAQIQARENWLNQIKDLFTLNWGKAFSEKTILYNTKSQIESGIQDLDDKIEKLEFFVSEVSQYFSDSLEVLSLAIQGATQLSKIIVDSDGNYYANGVDMSWVQKMKDVKIVSHAKRDFQDSETRAINKASRDMMLSDDGDAHYRAELKKRLKGHDKSEWDKIIDDYNHTLKIDETGNIIEISPLEQGYVVSKNGEYDADYTHLVNKKFDELKAQKFEANSTALDAISDLSNSSVLNFNYTNTSGYLFGTSEERTHFIHGRIDLDRSFSRINTMVFGIEDKENDVNSDLIPYQKYYQRVVKETGNKFEEFFKRTFYDIGDAFGGQLPNSKNIIVFGHSVDPLDKEIFQKCFELAENGKYIYRFVFTYFDELAKRSIIKNLAIILGKEKLVELTGKRNLVFIKSDDKDGMKNVLLS